MRAQIGGWLPTEGDAVAELRELVARVCPTLSSAEVAAVTRQLQGRYVVEERGAGARGWAVLHAHPAFFLSDLTALVSDVIGGDSDEVSFG